MPPVEDSVGFKLAQSLCLWLLTQEVDLLIASDVIWGDRGRLVAEVALRLVRRKSFKMSLK